MTVGFGPGIIRVNHDLLGKGELSFQLGPLSTELAIWLKAKIELIRSGHDPNEIKLASTTLRAWDHRCRLAAYKGYLQPYSDQYGNLTQLGETMAEYAKAKIDMHYSHLMEIHALEPDYWTTADDALVIASFTMRQASMLKLLHTAILDAERTNRTELDEQWHDPRKDKKPTEGIFDTLEQQTKKEAVEEGHWQISDSLDTMKMQETSQEFQALVIDGGPDLGRLAWVPTAIFGQKARNDLKTLIKFGVVDHKQLIGAGRGRPKHVVRVSPPGIVVVNHLIRKRMI